jgi:D-ribose pyranase
VQEGGILNREIARVIARMGHMDELIVCDAGFPIPDGVETVDLALAQDKPKVPEVLALLKKDFSVEKIIVAEETSVHSPSMLREIMEVLGKDLPVETMPHSALKERSKDVKAIIRTGDFTAYTNVLLVSGAGNRWFVERP